MKQKKISVGIKKGKKEDSDEKGMKVPLNAHMHFKEGRSFAVPSPQREQNEISPQDAFKINTHREKVDPKQDFCVLCANQSESNNGCGYKQKILNKRG